MDGLNRLAMACDHAGFDLKENLADFLRNRRCEILDLGTYSRNPVDYPDYAEKIGISIRRKEVFRGILICGSGVGASVCANKIPGIRASICHDTYSAHQGVEHDDMNILVLGARVVAIKLAEELSLAFIQASFSGEFRHIRRLKKMESLEHRHWSPL